MKRFFLFASLCVPTASALHAQTGEENKVKEALVAVFDGISAADMSFIRQHITADFLLLESGAVWNTDSVEARVAKLKTSSSYHPTYHLDFIQFHIHGNSAWTAYHNKADVIVNGKTMSLNWLESAVFVKEDGTWKVQMLHSTKLP
jgi:hypothetical protein